MGQIDHGLKRSLDLSSGHFVEAQRQHDGHRKGQEDLQQIQDDGVLQNGREHEVSEQVPEVLQAHKGGTQNAPRRLVILKRDHQEADGNVAENEEEHNSRQSHQIERIVAAEIRPPGRLRDEPALCTFFHEHSSSGKFSHFLLFDIV